LNKERTNTGLPELSHADELVQAVRRHSYDMASNNFTSHTGLDGSDGGGRIKDTCYPSAGWGEIIGWGFDGNTAKMVRW
jgi:uncharacterized protein YkwD